jgi:hypothetical protein
MELEATTGWYCAVLYCTVLCSLELRTQVKTRKGGACRCRLTLGGWYQTRKYRHGLIDRYPVVSCLTVSRPFCSPSPFIKAMLYPPQTTHCQNSVQPQPHSFTPPGECEAFFVTPATVQEIFLSFNHISPPSSGEENKLDR